MTLLRCESTGTKMLFKSWLFSRWEVLFTVPSRHNSGVADFQEVRISVGNPVRGFSSHSLWLPQNLCGILFELIRCECQSLRVCDRGLSDVVETNREIQPADVHFTGGKIWACQESTLFSLKTLLFSLVKRRKLVDMWEGERYIKPLTTSTFLNDF